MFSLTIKGLWAHKLRYALTGLAVVLGVAFMAGTMVLTDTMEKTFDGVFASANDGTDVIVQRAGAIDGELGDRPGPGRRRRSSTRSPRSTASPPPPARSRASPSWSRPTAPSPPTDGLGVTIGANWIDDERLNPFTLASGRAPDGRRRGRASTRSTAERPGLGARRPRSRCSPRPARPSSTLVGTATYGDLGGVPGLVAGRHRPTPPPSGSSPSPAATTASLVAARRRRRRRPSWPTASTPAVATAGLRPRGAHRRAGHGRQAGRVRRTTWPSSTSS